MSSKIGEWEYNYTGYATAVSGTLNFNCQYTTLPGVNNCALSGLVINQVDRNNNSQLAWLKTINKDALIHVTISKECSNRAPGENCSPDAGKSWWMQVSGEPTAPVPGGSWTIPVASISATNGESGFTPSHNNYMTIYGPSYGGTAASTAYTTEGAYLDTSDISTYVSRSSQWDTREGDIRKKMYKMTQAQNNISHIYKELLRAMIAAFSDVGYISSEDKFIHTKCVHANAERTVAKLKEDNNVILPILSIAQTVTNNDKERRRTENLLVHEKYWDSEKARAFRILSFSPRAVNVMYQLNVWTKYMSDMDQILEQVRLKFNPEMEVPTKFSTLTKGLIDTEENIGKLEAADKEDRILQKTINITVRTYIPSPKFLVTSTGEIEKFLIET